MADIKNFGIVGVGGTVQYGKGGGSLKWDTDGFVSTSDGTTLADLDAAGVNFTGLSGTGAVTVTNILDEDNMASDSATALATQQSIKAYVDAQVGGGTLSGTGDSGAFSVNLASNTFGVFGGTNLTSTGSGSNVTIALDSNISLTSVTATGTVQGGTLTDGTLSSTAGTITGGVAATFSGAVQGGSLTDGTATLTAGDLTGAGNVTASGTVTGGTLTDGTLSSTAGTITGGVAATFSGAVQGGSLTDGTLTSSAGTITGGVGATFSGTVDAGTVEFDNLSGTGSVSVTDIIDDDSMASASATTLATSESIKAYVDAQTHAGTLDIQGDSGSGNVDLLTQVLDVAGGTNLTSVASGQTITVNLDNSISLGNVTATGTVQGGTLTDGTLSSTAGTITGGVAATFSGAVQGGSLTDGTATLSSGALSGATTGSFSGNVSAGNISATDGTFSGSVTFGSGSGGTLTGLTSVTSQSVVATSNIVLNSYTVTDILDEDNMASDSNTALATQQSIKAYVDAQLGASALDIQGDSGSGSIDLDSQVLDVAGGTNITTSASGQTLTVNLDNSISLGNVTATGTVQGGTLTDGTLSSTAGTITGGVAATFSGAVQGGSLTDGTLTSSAGTITGGVAATFSGAVQGGSLTDGTLTSSAGTITGGVAATFSGAVQGGSLTDGTATLSSGALSGATTGSFSGTVTAGNVNASTGLVTFNTLSDGTLTMSAILDEDNMASDSDTALATQQSIKAYVDSQTGALATSFLIQGDSGSGNITLGTDTLDIAGTANEIETSYDNNTKTLTVGLPNDITIAGNATISGTLLSDDITASTVAITGDMTVSGDTVMTGNLTVNGNTTIINSNTIQSGDAIIVLNADLPSGTAPSLNSGWEVNRGSSANVEVLWLEGVDYFVFQDENDVLQEVRAGTFNASTFTGGDYTGANATLTGDVAFGTLTDSGESITITKFVDEADGISSNDNDTTIPTSAAVKDYVDNNAGDGNLLRNGSVGTGSSTVTIATAPSVAGRTYYVEKVVINTTVAFSGNSVDHITIAENAGAGAVLVANADADVTSTGVYVVESNGATTLTAGQTIVLTFRDSGGSAVSPTAGAASVAVYFGWV